MSDRSTDSSESSASTAGSRRNPRRAVLLTIAGVALLLLAATGAVAVAAMLGPDDQVARPAGPPSMLPADTAPDGWRTEQYRDITFQVPADWGYAYEPGPAWCAGSDGKTPRPEHRKPYVALGEPDAVPAIACPEMPDALLTEHVAAIQPMDKKADGQYELGNGFTEVTRTIGAVRLRAVSEDVDLAQRIVDSGAEAGPGAACQPDHELITDPAARPDLAADVADYGTVDRIALCQYDVGKGRVGLRAAGELTGDRAQRLIDGIAEAPVDPTACEHKPQGADMIDIAAVLRVQTGDGIREIILRQRGCPEGGDVVIGGFDDGTQVRATTPDTCRAVLTKPVQIQSGSGAVFDRCVG